MVWGCTQRLHCSTRHVYRHYIAFTHHWDSSPGVGTWCSQLQPSFLINSTLIFALINSIKLCIFLESSIVQHFLESHDHLVLCHGTLQSIITGLMNNVLAVLYRRCCCLHKAKGGHPVSTRGSVSDRDQNE